MRRGEQPAHAEAGDADCRRRAGVVADQVVDGGGHVAGGPLRGQAGHQLSGLVDLGVSGHLALVQVGSERGEALPGEQVANPLDLGHEPPPLLQHDHTGTRAPGRSGDVAPCCRSIGGELHHLTHRLHLLGSPWFVGSRGPQSCQKRHPDARRGLVVLAVLAVLVVLGAAGRGRVCGVCGEQGSEGFAASSGLCGCGEQGLAGACSEQVQELGASAGPELGGSHDR